MGAILNRKAIGKPFLNGRRCNAFLNGKIILGVPYYSFIMGGGASMPLFGMSSGSAVGCDVMFETPINNNTWLMGGGAYIQLTQAMTQGIAVRINSFNTSSRVASFQLYWGATNTSGTATIPRGTLTRIHVENGQLRVNGLLIAQVAGTPSGSNVFIFAGNGAVATNPYRGVMGRMYYRATSASPYIIFIPVPRGSTRYSSTPAPNNGFVNVVAGSFFAASPTVAIYRQTETPRPI